MACPQQNSGLPVLRNEGNAADRPILNFKFCIFHYAILPHLVGQRLSKQNYFAATDSPIQLKYRAFPAVSAKTKNSGVS